MQQRKITALICAAVIAACTFAGCAKNDDTVQSSDVSSDTSDTASLEEQPLAGTIKAIVLDGEYGSQMWQEVADKFTEENPEVVIELTAREDLESVLSAAVNAGDYPDFVYLPQGREAGLTEKLMLEGEIANITPLLEMEVPNEGVTVAEKLISGFTDTIVTDPYNNNSMYFAPAFYSPCGLWYNAALFEEKEWPLPQTWEDMWALGETAKSDKIDLFTYPAAGYFDTFVYAMINQLGGAMTFNEAMLYEDGAWTSMAITQMFEIIGKLADYMAPTTVENATQENFGMNQQLVLNNKALFMPNGSWIVDETAELSRADGFEWGVMPLPAAVEGGVRYAFSFFDQMWIAQNGENRELALHFLSFLYSDAAAEIFINSAEGKPAVMPIKNAAQFIADSDIKKMYSIYDSGAKAAVGGFAAVSEGEGANMRTALLAAIDSLVAGDINIEEWQTGVIETAIALRERLEQESKL